MNETYKVTLTEPTAIPGQQRIRAGVVVTKQDGYEGVLTEDQLVAIEADPQLTVVKVSSSKPKAQPKKSK